MALPNNLAFVTVMDVSLIDRQILNGGTYTFAFDDATHTLPFKNTVGATLTATIDGSGTGVTVDTTTNDEISINKGTTSITFTLSTGAIALTTGDSDPTESFTLTMEALTPASLITELEDTATGYITTNATLDTLTISNVTQEGPRKESRGGKNNIPVVRYGKTARLEIEDVVFNLEALSYLSDANVSEDLETIDFVETFPKNCSIIGDTYVVDKNTGDRSEAYLVFYDFLPDGLMNINMESEGDIGVMSAAGELFAVDNKFYTIIEKE